jgi:outer membrane protein W
MLLDVAYVGSIGRHGLHGYDMNRPGFGSAWLPQNQDPTVTPKYDGTTTLPVNLYRPYQGHGSINMYQFGASSNYNGLQMSLNRRLGAGLQAGVAYAWSKSLGTATGDA